MARAREGTSLIDRQVEPLVLDSEISGLDDRHAFLKLGNNVARFHFDYIDLPKIAEEFISRPVEDDELRFDPATLAPKPDSRAANAKPAAVNRRLGKARMTHAEALDKEPAHVPEINLEAPLERLDPAVESAQQAPEDPQETLTNMLPAIVQPAHEIAAEDLAIGLQEG